VALQPNKCNKYLSKLRDLRTNIISKPITGPWPQKLHTQQQMDAQIVPYNPTKGTSPGVSNNSSQPAQNQRRKLTHEPGSRATLSTGLSCNSNLKLTLEPWSPSLLRNLYELLMPLWSVNFWKWLIDYSLPGSYLSTGLLLWDSCLLDLVNTGLSCQPLKALQECDWLWGKLAFWVTPQVHQPWCWSFYLQWLMCNRWGALTFLGYSMAYTQ
jgi:hypothetical protein